jgi:hypothetical protein
MDAWASARPFFSKGAAPAWVVDVDDQERLQAYALYENIYRINPGAFKLMQRGSDNTPIYLPKPRELIEATQRFLAVDWNYVVDPKVGIPGDRDLVSMLIRKIFKREKMYSTFSMQKRWGLIRGDQIWHVIADSTKPAGSKISVKAVDPANYFPIVDENDASKTIGVHLVDVIIDPNDPAGTKTVARRQTYRKTERGRISSELALFELAKWDDRNLPPDKIEKIMDLMPVVDLPEQITALPVYHIINNQVPGLQFGSSQLQGVERVFAAMNQSISDEDLTLVLQGLGLYVTNAGPPKNADGTTGFWDLGPGQVIEGMGADFKFERVSGVSTVAPMLEHIQFLSDSASSALAVSDMAAGKVDVTVAESGISLQMQLAPLLAANAEKEQEILDVGDHLLYDLAHAWLPAYEGVSNEVAVEVVSTCGDPMPQNRDAEIKQIMDLVAAKLLSAQEGRVRLIALGFDLAENGSVDEIVAETQALALARNADPFVNRYASEFDKLDGASGNNPSSQGANNGAVGSGTVA